jgi:hypothetical protein
MGLKTAARFQVGTQIFILTPNQYRLWVDLQWPPRVKWSKREAVNSPSSKAAATNSIHYPCTTSPPEEQLSPTVYQILPSTTQLPKWPLLVLQ